MAESFIRWFKELGIEDVPQVGGKNASLGEMYCSLVAKGICIPQGFATTAAAYRYTLEKTGLDKKIREILSDLDTHNIANLKERGHKIRTLIRGIEFPDEVKEQIFAAYDELCAEYGRDTDVAVRSSATAEDLPDASFAGQQDSFLNIRGKGDLLRACLRCFSSLFTDRAISYREDKGFDHLSIALSIGVQKMVRSDLASAGVMFSIDTETGFKNAVLITAVYGLGEMIVQGKVTPDEYCVFKPTLQKGFRPIISKTVGSKKMKMIYDDDDRHPTKEIPVLQHERDSFVLCDDEVLKLAEWAITIEEHYSAKAGRFMPMDIEWAKDGNTGELFIVQARPETVISQRDMTHLTQFKMMEKGDVLTIGRAVGQKIGNGKACVIRSPKEIDKFQKGEVLVTDNTDPDWEPIMKIASAIVTNRGGRTSHAAIVSREMGIPCVVATNDATLKIQQGQEVTVSCAEGEDGKVYNGKLHYEEHKIDITNLPQTTTKIMMNVGNPESAFDFSFLPSDGVGLARLEFIINSYIKIHPLALIHFNNIKDKDLRHEIEDLTHGYNVKTDFFIERMAQGVAKIVAAFYPKPVIVRMSDFKSNEYANLIAGHLYEPHEENPMIGWRGASRYYSNVYRSGFDLECLAMKKVREEYGLDNLKLMIPFCRTVEEAKKVVAVMRENGIEQKNWDIYGMCEIPANVILADEFLEVFDGFSIGTNDLTQLTLGLDRDSGLVADIFDERNNAVVTLVKKVIAVAKEKGKYIGICGDAPSTYPEYLHLLIEAGIDSISLSPDAVVSARLAASKAETNKA